MTLPLFVSRLVCLCLLVYLPLSGARPFLLTVKRITLSRSDLSHHRHHRGQPSLPRGRVCRFRVYVWRRLRGGQ